MTAVTRLGLTGGIGSGKSTVAQILADLGAAIIDADAIARSVTLPAGAAIGPIATEFGSDFITPQGALDRDRMRELAFADASAKRRLEAIVHPLVGQETQRQADAAIRTGRRCIVFDIPLLVESGRWRQHLDWVLVLDCTAETQIERVMARSKLSRSAVEQIIAAQAPRLQRLAAADMVIANDNLPLALLRAQVLQIAPRFGL
ncbi:dephospho-CoA kinase [Rhodoferax sediminis]|uniref:Dephospho-CoA kinase n=1 Tax=Rhodoferax sediminis TaxID=2509614 RepID=A0A515D842_9BURK|nr:dephospho-CoA kinase [Rhodoferax sediminis]QDL36568.1 dephospho-CoA kinase [Rhodoferax sediminis]